MINYFTLQNTDGYSQDELNKMNQLLQIEISDIDLQEDHVDYNEIVKELSEKIFNSFK